MSDDELRMLSIYTFYCSLFKKINESLAGAFRIFAPFVFLCDSERGFEGRPTEFSSGGNEVKIYKAKIRDAHTLSHFIVILRT
jgi:hypothetical protein